jgi:hypothetical protein
LLRDQEAQQIVSVLDFGRDQPELIRSAAKLGITQRNAFISLPSRPRLAGAFVAGAVIVGTAALLIPNL